MSLEQLLLIAFLIVFPLLERLIRVLRARARGSPADPANTPVPQGRRQCRGRPYLREQETHAS